MRIAATVVFWTVLLLLALLGLDQLADRSEPLTVAAVFVLLGGLVAWTAHR